MKTVSGPGANRLGRMRRITGRMDVKTNYVLIDYENVHVKSLALLKAEHFRVWVFLGPKNTRLPVDFVLAMQELNDRAEYILLQSSGSNALDFHIAYYLGILAAKDPEGFFYVISKDTGFDPLILHMKTRSISTVRSPSIEDMPCFEKPASSEPVKRATNPKAISSTAPIDGLLKVAIDDLIKRRSSKPRTLKTLRNTIHAKCGKTLPAEDIDAVCEALVMHGYVTVIGKKVTYALPAGSS